MVFSIWNNEVHLIIQQGNGCKIKTIKFPYCPEYTESNVASAL